MALLFKHIACPACGHRHHFGLDGDQHDPDQEYEFVCPETGETATLRPPEQPEGATHWPQGAIPLQGKPA